MRTSPSSVERLVHPCLDPLPDAGEPVSGRLLTHQQRLGVLLQAAGLLALLDRAGWGLPDWEAARLGRGGGGVRLFVGGRLGPPRTPRPCQELLRELLGRLFGSKEADLRGPGAAKRAARALAGHWCPSLVPLAPDEAVAQVLDAAPFLWEPSFGADRAALAGEIHRIDPDGADEETVLLWIAGPRIFRRQVRAAATGLAEAQALLAGGEARRLWDREEEGEPCALAAAGRWRAALAAWELRPPVREAERVERARALMALGRFEAALVALVGLGSPAALLARAEAQIRLGELAAVLAALRELKKARLSPEEAADLADVAARTFANQGTPEGALPWLRRALSTAGSAGTRAGLRARIAAAAAAWDRGEPAVMDRFLEESRAALDEPDLAWRWHQVQALRELEDDDGAARAVAHMEAALSRRRFLPRHLAADLWNEAGRARAAAGDLPGAERAFLHQVRLLEGCDGPRKATLALFNLAEIRLRRGRLAGVREILERSTAENRRTGNQRGLAQDAELWARLELVLGQPEAALEVCREALEEQQRHGHGPWRRFELRLLAARALGWLGRPDEAASSLAGMPPGTLRELEPEERPALYALGGDLPGAGRETEALAAPALRELWGSLLAGVVPAEAWSALSLLEPFRAARLVVDAELCRPGTVPVDVRRQAGAVLRGAGSLPLADALDARDGGAWQVAALLLARLAHGSGPPAREDEDAVRREPVPPPGARRLGRDGEMVGESALFQAALARLDLLAGDRNLSLLILGESGTGKELAARRTHRASPRAAAPFVAVNCAALSETLLLSELFGHARGAFTGADRDRLGVFQTADGGTVFLDEIGDLPMEAQGKLLRTIQEGEIQRLGESVPRKVNVRVVAATHRDLPSMVEVKEFRLDFYHRLRGGCVELPPLRSRGDDVLLLAERFLERTGVQLSREARGRLIGHPWPGNVRELHNVLAAAVALAGGGRILQPEHLELPDSGPPAGLSYQEQMDAARRRAVFGALEACGGNKAAAARRLGLSRQGLHHLLQELGTPPKPPRR